MARSIDPHNLNADDIAYIEQRSWLIQEFGLQGFDYEALKAEVLGTDDDEDDSDDDGNDGDPGSTSPDPGETPAEENTEVEGTSADDEDDDDEDEEDEDEPEDYTGEDWTFQALKDEIDARNEDVADSDSRISKAGGADDLRARLIEDDEANEAAVDAEKD